MDGGGYWDDLRVGDCDGLSDDNRWRGGDGGCFSDAGDSTRSVGDRDRLALRRSWVTAFRAQETTRSTSFLEYLESIRFVRAAHGLDFHEHRASENETEHLPPPLRQDPEGRSSSGQPRCTS